MEATLKYVIEMLEFVLFKLRKVQAGEDECSMDELDTIRDFFAHSLDVRVTTDDIAEYYGKSNESVRAALSRHYIPPREWPTRKKAWRISFVHRIVPESWNKRGDQQ